MKRSWGVRILMVNTVIFSLLHKHMLWVLIRSPLLMSTKTMFLWRNKEHYLRIIILYNSSVKIPLDWKKKLTQSSILCTQKTIQQMTNQWYLFSFFLLFSFSYKLWPWHCDQLQTDYKNIKSCFLGKRRKVFQTVINNIVFKFQELTFSMLGKYFSINFEIIFLFFPENRVWHFMGFISLVLGDNLQEMSNPIFR